MKRVRKFPSLWNLNIRIRKRLPKVEDYNIDGSAKVVSELYLLRNLMYKSKLNRQFGSSGFIDDLS